ncbi:RNA polymerase sigma factor [Nocardioides aequoreus]|uniref:RNA polymerase sigma factor n=1 Tax=Nocardioides aequoreus TaxID=397278 RepID=UPI000A0330DC|nr:sigma-70 family RNA polymerase sigma factor [Nocardioides aequoreus]
MDTGRDADRPDQPGGATPGLLEELYAAHYRRLLRLATLLLGDAAQGEDVVQDVFVTVHHRPDLLTGVDDVAAYLRRSVVNGARSAQRRRVVALRHRGRATDPTQTAGHAPGADAAVLDGVRRRAVLDAVAALPRRQREVVALRYYLDLSEREIAATLGISQGAVKSHASRGAAALRQRLAPLTETGPGPDTGPPDDRPSYAGARPEQPQETR